MMRPSLKLQAAAIAIGQAWQAWANDSPATHGMGVFDAGTESVLVPMNPKPGQLVRTLRPLFRWATRAGYQTATNDATVWRVRVRRFADQVQVAEFFSDAGMNEAVPPVGAPLPAGVRLQYAVFDPSFNAGADEWIDFETTPDAVNLAIPARADLPTAFAARPVQGRAFPASMAHYQAGGAAEIHAAALNTGTNGLQSFKNAAIATQTDQGGAAQLECSRILRCAWLSMAGNAEAKAHGLARLRNMLSWSTGKYGPATITVSNGGTLATVAFSVPTRYKVGITTNVAFEGCSNAALNSSAKVCTGVDAQTLTYANPGVADGVYTCTLTRCVSLSHLFDDPARFKLVALAIGYSAWRNDLTADECDAIRDHIGYAGSMVLEPMGYGSWGVPMWRQAFANSYMGRWAWQRNDHAGHGHEWLLVLCFAMAMVRGDEADFRSSHFGLAAMIPDFCRAASNLLHLWYVSATEGGGSIEGHAYHAFAFYFSPAIDGLVNALGLGAEWWRQARWTNAVRLACLGARKGSGPTIQLGDDGYRVYSPQLILCAGVRSASPHLALAMQAQGITWEALDSDPNWPFHRLNASPLAVPALQATPSFHKYTTDDLETQAWFTANPLSGDAPTALVAIKRRGRWNHDNGGAGGFQLAANGRRLIVQSVNLPGTVGISDQHKTAWGNRSLSAACWAWGTEGSQVDGLQSGPMNRGRPVYWRADQRSAGLVLDLAKAYRRPGFVHSVAMRAFVWFDPGLLLVLDRAELVSGADVFSWRFPTVAAPQSAGLGQDVALYGVTSSAAVRTVDANPSAWVRCIAGAGIVAPTGQVINDDAWPAGTAPPATAITNAAYPESPNGTLNDAAHRYWHNRFTWPAAGAVFAPVRIETVSQLLSGEAASVAGSAFTWSASYAGRPVSVAFDWATGALSFSG